jgi:hypothetical protein
MKLSTDIEIPEHIQRSCEGVTRALSTRNGLSEAEEAMITNAIEHAYKLGYLDGQLYAGEQHFKELLKKGV